MNNIYKKITQIFAFSLVFTAPLLSFLRFNDYSYAQAEAWALIGCLVALGLLVAACYAVSNWVIRTLLTALSVTFAVSFFPGWQIIEVLLATFFCMVMLTMLFAKETRELLTIFFTALILGILILPMQKQFSNTTQWQKKTEAINRHLPFFLYIILDEHAGIDAIPTNTVLGQQVKKQLISFYIASGFHVYGSAYSHYPATCNSIPNLLNFTYSNVDDSYFKDPNHRLLKQNILFKALTEKGYQIRVYQPDFINYCYPQQAKVSYCYMYPSLSIKNLQQASLSFSTRFIVLLKSFLLQSSLYQTVMLAYQNYIQPYLVAEGWPAPEWAWYQARVSTLPILSVFNALRTDIVQHPNGTAYFVHLLAPHNPFIYDANCHILPASQWQIGHGPLPLINTTETRDEHYAIYEGQIQCVQKQIALLFDTLQSAGIYNNAIIIIHGDHGARIALHRPTDATQNQLTQQDFRDYYNALFVAKFPGAKPGYDHQLIDLQTLLAQVMNVATDKKIATSRVNPYVYLFPNDMGLPMNKKTVSSFLSGSAQ